MDTEDDEVEKGKPEKVSAFTGNAEPVQTEEDQHEPNVGFNDEERIIS